MLFTGIRSVRGAIGVETGEADSIAAAVALLMDRLMEANRLRPRRLVHLLFSVTDDLSALNPAAALRRERSGYEDVPLFCCVEPPTDGSPPRMIRVLAVYRAFPGRRPVPVYLGRAAGLRPDLAEVGEGTW